jgi:hypothetical protein
MGFASYSPSKNTCFLMNAISHQYSATCPAIALCEGGSAKGIKNKEFTDS